MTTLNLQNDDELIQTVYAELRSLAARHIAAEPSGLSFGATDLVHEAYLRLKNRSDRPTWANLLHYYLAAGEAMRRILVDRARRRKALKRGGDRERRPLGDPVAKDSVDSVDVLALSDALEGLKSEFPRCAEVVTLRYFAGLSIDDTAAIVGVAPSTIDTDWAFARAWLHIALTGSKKSL